MNIKVMQVFYNSQALPFKDSELQVHFPIVGGAFQGASNTVEIHFYLDEMGTNVSWVVNGKLPNGKIGHTLLTNRQFDSALNKYYYVFTLNAFYTQYKGDLYLGLSGYQGNISYTYDSDTDTYTITGTPTIQTTGVIKLNIAYSTGILNGDIDEDVTLEDIMSALGQKINSLDGVVVLKQEYDSINSYDVSDYEDGQIFYIQYRPLRGFYSKNEYGSLVVANQFIGQAYRQSMSNGTILGEGILQECNKRYCLFVYGSHNDLYLKMDEDSTYNYFTRKANTGESAGMIIFEESRFKVNKSTGEVSDFVTNTYLTYSLDKEDDLLGGKVNLGKENFNNVTLNELLNKYGRVFYCKNTYDGYYYRLELTLVGGDTTISFRIYQLNTRFVYVSAVNANSYASSVLTSTYRYEYINNRDTQTIGGNKTFTTSPQTNEIITDESAGTKLITKKYVLDLTGNIPSGKTLQGQIDDLDTIVNGNAEQGVVGVVEKIPSQANASNKLADKDWVNSTINSLAAFYITKNAQGDPFATYSELMSATTFYSGGVVRVPTRNDYCLVVSDENHDNASCRYIYQGNQWEFQFVVNETPFTSDQIKAINSGITDTLVAQITTNANAISVINGKLPITKDFVIPTTAWSLVDGKYVAVLDSGNDFVINDNAVHIYTPTSDSDQLIRDMYGINVSSNGTTQKFTFVCNLSDTAPTEVINFTIAQFGGN